MNRSLLAGLFLLFQVMKSAAPELEPTRDWALVFDDEFSGARLNRYKWSTEMEFPGIHGPRYHNEYYASYTLDRNVSVADGLLSLSTNKEIVSGTEPEGLFEYSQGLVVSRFSFLYGRIDIRARYPKGPGLWPCLWLMPRDGTWPPEVDIAEYFGCQRKMHHGVAYGSDVDVQWDSSGDAETDFTDWHVISFDWSQKTCKWLVDGRLKKEVRAAHVPHIPMYLILSNSVGSKSSAAGTADETTKFPNRLEIDYVRIYQHSSANTL